MDRYFGFFALKLMSLHKYKFYQKNLLYSKIIQLSGDILVEITEAWKYNDIIAI